MINKIYEKIGKFIKINYKFIITLLVILFLSYYELPFVVYKSGGVIDLKNRVSIDRDYEEKGNLKMSYVTSMKGTIPIVILSYIIPDWDLIPLKDITSDNNYEKVIEIGKEYLQEGLDNAIISAFNETNYQVNITKNLLKVIYITDKAQTDLKIGDEVLTVNDIEINDFNLIKEYINTLEENDEITIKVKKDNKVYNRKAKVYKEKDNTLKIGIAFHEVYEYETEIPVKIKMKDNESGSSGGLMMSLAIYNALVREDITKGRNIVGTGAINKEGKIEEISGIKYKLIAAEKNRADIFLCPHENYKEALKVKKKNKLKVNIIEVESLKDAIQKLKQ